MNKEGIRIVIERKKVSEVDESIKKVRIELKEETDPDKVVYEIDEGVFEFVLDDYKAWFGNGYVLVEVDE